MFPYLRTLEQFVNDCETISHCVVCKNGKYELQKLESPGDYSKIENCEECTDSCKTCQYISAPVAWLINNVLRAKQTANFEDSNGSIDNRSWGQVKAWCQSVCVYMHDVLEDVLKDETFNNKNLVVGLEYYVDYQAYKHVRADIIIGGYGLRHKKKMLVIELKQWSDNKIDCNGQWIWTSKNKPVDNPGSQCVDYTTKMRNAVEEHNTLDPIIFIPCVYLHNMERLDSDYSGIQYNETEKYFTDDRITNGDERVRYYIKNSYLSAYNSYLSAYIKEIFNENNNNTENTAIEVFREYKKRHKIWSVSELAAILKKDDITEYINRLHWDQEYVLFSLLKYIFSDEESDVEWKKENLDRIQPEKIRDNKTIDIVYGGPGSGKTLLAMLLLRLYNYTSKNKGVYAYNIVPAKNAFLNEYEKNLNDNIITQDEYIHLTAMFKYWKDIATKRENYDLDLVIFDEAQAVKNSDNNLEENIKKLINNHKHIVFLADPIQAIKGEQFLNILSDVLDKNSNLKSIVKKHYLWSHFRCHSDEGYVTWIEQVLSMNTDSPQIASPYTEKLGGNLYYDNLDFKPKGFIYFDGNDLENTFSENGVDDPKSIYYLSLVVIPYKEKDDHPEQLNNAIKNYNNYNTAIQTDPYNATVRKYGLSEEGDHAKVDSVRGVEYNRVMVVFGPEFYVLNEELYVRDVKIDNQLVPAEDVKKMYRILMTRSLKEVYFLFVDEAVKNYFENFGNPNTQ